MTGLRNGPPASESKWDGQGDRWACYVCRNGLVLTKRRLGVEAEVGSRDGSVLLLGGESRDFTVNEPPLALSPTDSEVEWIRSAGPAAIAATWFGPEEQSKSSNQDFALAARIRTKNGGEFIFAAVADGVTTKTFWAARTARLACLTALRVVANALAADRYATNADIDDLRNVLAAALRKELERDRDLLLAVGAVPNDWSADVFARNRNNSEFWYNATLLISVLGAETGFLLFAGDGGIHVSKRTGGQPPIFNRPLITDSNPMITSYVSLHVTAADFRAARIGDIQAVDSIDVVLATDGVDRTLQLTPHNDYDRLDLSSPEASLRELKQLATLPKHEVDNYSVARITWPPYAAPRAPRLTAGLSPPSALPPPLARPEARADPIAVAPPFIMPPLSVTPAEPVRASHLSIYAGAAMIMVAFLAGGALVSIAFVYNIIGSKSLVGAAAVDARQAGARELGVTEATLAETPGSGRAEANTTETTATRTAALAATDHTQPAQALTATGTPGIPATDDRAKLTKSAESYSINVDFPRSTPFSLTKWFNDRKMKVIDITPTESDFESPPSDSRRAAFSLRENEWTYTKKCASSNIKCTDYALVKAANEAGVEKNYHLIVNSLPKAVKLQ